MDTGEVHGYCMGGSGLHEEVTGVSQGSWGAVEKFLGKGLFELQRGKSGAVRG